MKRMFGGRSDSLLRIPIQPEAPASVQTKRSHRCLREVRNCNSRNRDAFISASPSSFETLCRLRQDTLNTVSDDELRCSVLALRETLSKDHFQPEERQMAISVRRAQFSDATVPALAIASHLPLLKGRMRDGNSHSSVPSLRFPTRTPEKAHTAMRTRPFSDSHLARGGSKTSTAPRKSAGSPVRRTLTFEQAAPKSSPMMAPHDDFGVTGRRYVHQSKAAVSQQHQDARSAMNYLEGFRAAYFAPSAAPRGS